MPYGVELREFTYEADGTGEKEHGADLTAPAVSAMPHACAHALWLSLTNDRFRENRGIGAGKLLPHAICFTRTIS